MQPRLSTRNSHAVPISLFPGSLPVARARRPLGYTLDEMELQYVGPHALRLIRAGNTQVRRLGYLTAICGVAKETPRARDLVASDLVEWHLAHAEDFASYRRLVSGRGAVMSVGAATRYLDVAEALSLVSSTAGAVARSPFADLVNILAKQAGGVSFAQPSALRLFYLYWLLLHDADFLILVLAAAAHGVSIKDLQSRFQSLFVERLEAKRAVVSPGLWRDAIDESLFRATHRWRRPERYAEHLLPPRAEWLLDLGMLQATAYRKRTYLLSENGSQFLELLPRIAGTGIVDVSGDWMWSESLGTIAKVATEVQDVRLWSTLSDADRSDLVAGWLVEAFSTFALLGMKAAAMLPTLLFACIKCTVENRVHVNLAELANWIDTSRIEGIGQYRVLQSPNESAAYIRQVSSPRENLSDGC